MDKNTLKVYRQMHKKVFRYTSSKVDEPFFKRKLQDWLMNGCQVSFISVLWQMVHRVNDNGKTTKYCYFNEYHQRLYIDKHFFQWAKKTVEEMERVLKTLNNEPRL